MKFTLTYYGSLHSSNSERTVPWTYGDSLQVTLRFARAESEVLTSIPRAAQRLQAEDYRPLPSRYYI